MTLVTFPFVENCRRSEASPYRSGFRQKSHYAASCDVFERFELSTEARHHFESQLREQWEGTGFSGARALVAVSGGADSVALLRALLAIVEDRNSLSVAHFNHGWRGEESDADERFVQELCDSQKVQCQVGRAEGETASPSNRSEEEARERRYAFLQETAYAVGARSIVTAHTQSDRVETVLHNLFRGTGIAGLRGFDKTRPIGAELILVRPLRGLTRSEVVCYLEAIGQDYREDSSNADQRYKRNFLRQELLPVVRAKYGSSLDSNIARLADITSELNELLGQLAMDYWNQVEQLSTATDGSSIRFPDSSKLSVAWPVLQRALVERWKEFQWPTGKMTAEHWNKIRSLHELTEPAGSENTSQCNLPNNLLIRWKDGWFEIKPAGVN